MEKTIEELILQELREIKGTVNSLGVRMDSLETKVDALATRMDSMEIQICKLKSRVSSLEETVADLTESVAEIRTACNLLLDWADEVYAIERVKNPNYARIGGIGMRNVKNNAVEEENARYYVESNGKRTYY